MNLRGIVRDLWGRRRAPAGLRTRGERYVVPSWGERYVVPSCSCGFCSMQVSHPFILLIRRRVDDRLGRNPIRPRVGLLPFAGSPRGMTGTGGSGTSSLHVDCSFCSIHVSYPFILLSASVTTLSFPAQVSFVFGVRPRSRGSLPRANGFPSVLSAICVPPGDIGHGGKRYALLPVL